MRIEKYYIMGTYIHTFWQELCVSDTFFLVWLFQTWRSYFYVGALCVQYKSKIFPNKVLFNKHVFYYKHINIHIIHECCRLRKLYSYLRCYIHWYNTDYSCYPLPICLVISWKNSLLQECNCRFVRIVVVKCGKLWSYQ